MFINSNQHLLAPSNCLHLCGLGTALLYIWLAIDTLSGGSLSVLLAVYFSAAALIIICSYYCRRQVLSFFHILSWAVIFRCIGLFVEPALEDDFYRYLWDGYIFAHYGSPYGIVPADFFGDRSLGFRWQTILDGINNPDLPTIYGPVLQYIFLLGFYIKSGAIWVIKLFFIAADIALIILLRRFISVPLLLAYAWCPLLIKEVAFTAHPDIIGVLFLMSGLFLFKVRIFRASSICFAVAVACKPFALLILPLLIMHKPLQSLGVFALTLLLLYLPFLIDGQTEYISIIVMGQQWEFNSSGFALLKLFGEDAIVRMIAATLTLVSVVGYWYCHIKYFSDQIPRGDWLFGIMLLFAPVVNPWYLLWLLPFAALYFSYWAWTASVVVVLAYVTGLNLHAPMLPAYNHPDWLRPLEYALIFCALCFDIYKYKAPQKKSFPILT